MRRAVQTALFRRLDSLRALIGIQHGARVPWTPRARAFVDNKGKPVVLMRPLNLGAALLANRRFRLPLLEFNNPYVKDMLY